MLRLKQVVLTHTIVIISMIMVFQNYYNRMPLNLQTPSLNLEKLYPFVKTCKKES